ncbi:hypothetical protein TNCV_1674801 [Trichonephila clavipes]|nr:hypothetical protein TNCV_1674801 [Trichonephila clavipes]
MFTGGTFQIPLLFLTIGEHLAKSRRHIRPESVQTGSVVPKVPGINPGEGVDICKCTMPVTLEDTLNPERVLSRSRSTSGPPRHFGVTTFSKT